MSFLSPKLIPVLLLPLALTGCSLSTANMPAGNVQSAAISGKAFGGQQPIQYAAVEIYAFGSTGYGSSPGTALASATTDANGVFQFANGSYTCTPDQPVYIQVNGGNSSAGYNGDLVLAAALGNCSAAPNSTVTVNEVTTAATAFALAQFFNPTNMGASPGTAGFGGSVVNSKGLVMAANYTVPTLVNLRFGVPNPNTSVVTVEAAKINSIANTLAACINSTGSTSTTETTTSCGKLYGYTKASYTTRPADPLQAAVSMALNPTLNVSNLYALAPAGSPFPGLAAAPSDWTIGVSYTAPAASNIRLGVNTGTTANLAIDANGNPWFPSNASATTSGVATFNPTTNAFTLVGNANLTHPQNVAVASTSPNGVYVSDSLSGHAVLVNATTHSTSLYTMATAQLGALAMGTNDALYATYTNTSTGAYGIANINGSALASLIATTYGSTSLLGSATAGTLYTAATSGTQSYLEQVTGATTTPAHSVFATAAAAGTSGQVIQTNKSGASAQLFWTLPSTSEFCLAGALSGCTTANLSTPQGAAVDGSGRVFVANSGNGGITELPSPTVSGPVHYTFAHNATNGNTMTTPYGIGIDASGNIWAINAGCTTTGCTPGTAVLSEIVGAATPAITPLASQIAGGINLIGTEPTN